MFASARRLITVPLRGPARPLELLAEGRHFRRTAADDGLDLRRVSPLGGPLPDAAVLLIQGGPVVGVVPADDRALLGGRAGLGSDMLAPAGSSARGSGNRG